MYAFLRSFFSEERSPMCWKQILAFTEDIYCRVEDDDVTALGAQMTYYFILAFFPFLIFLLTLVGYTPFTAEEVLGTIAGFLPETSYRMVSDILQEILAQRHDALLSIGMIATYWAASSGLTALIKGLNKAYDEEETRAWWKLRVLSLLFTLALAAVVLFTLALLVFGHFLGTHVFRLLAYPDNFETVWGFVKYGIPAIGMVVVFLLLYRYIPNRKLTFTGVLPGSLFASIGWISISQLFSFYVNEFGHYTRTYGSIGGIIALLIWLYLSSIIVLLGGEINAALQFKREGRNKPVCKSFGRRLFFWIKRGQA